MHLHYYYRLVFSYLYEALSATIKSIIFDSTIRYFREPNILPDLPSLGMNLNMLLMAFSILLVLVGLLNLIFKFVGYDINNFRKSKLFFILFIVGLIILASYYVSSDPLITPFLILVIVTLLFLVFYHVIFKSVNSAYNYLLFLLIGSVISISLLNYFNTKLERESLKTTALEINRVDSNLLSFMLDETLREFKNQKNVADIFENRYTNYDAAAFTVWAKSAMQKESLNSGIRFYDKNKKTLGEFFVGIDPDNKVFDGVSKGEEINIVELNYDNQNLDKYFAGIIKIASRGITIGYVSAFVSFNIKSIGAVNYPDFIESNLSILNRVIDVKQLKIFQFENKKLKQVYGDIYPSRDQIKQIFQTKLDGIYNDAWVKLIFGGENYETYLLKTPNQDSDIITSVSVEEKAFSWNLFNFFKTFIVHSLFIIVAFIIIVFSRVRKINLTFKSKLLFAFLVISIIPVVVLALYNAKIVNERAKEGIFSELSQRANYVEKHITSQLEKHKNRDIINGCPKCGKGIGNFFCTLFID